MICDICGEVIAVIDGYSQSESATQRHYWLKHPGVVPFSCQVCAKSPPGTGGHRCTRVSDGIVCPAFKFSRGEPQLNLRASAGHGTPPEPKEVDP